MKGAPYTVSSMLLGLTRGKTIIFLILPFSFLLYLTVADDGSRSPQVKEPKLLAKPETKLNHWKVKLVSLVHPFPCLTKEIRGRYMLKILDTLDVCQRQR